MRMDNWLFRLKYIKRPLRGTAPQWFENMWPVDPETDN